tara:strand:- start:84 stop:869 length:786 start_codon:yes stop_codon:yes gene_type:complete
MSNTHLSESGHWYDYEGNPKYEILSKNGSVRNTTLRDARKLFLVPSVTGIMGVAAKPGLENWKIDQGITAALTLERLKSENDYEFLSRIKADSKEQGLKAAEAGTIIHAQIEQGFLGQRKTKPYLAVKKLLDDVYPNEEWIAEGSFCHTSGYGGKIDLHSKTGIFIDFKTKDGLAGKEGSKLVYDEHGMQLSSYSQGMGISNPQRMNIFIDRKNTELIVSHVWDPDSHHRHLAMFNSLLTYWKLLKKYDPSEELIKLKENN